DGEPLEKQLSDMWLRLLGVDAIDTNANLFDQGARALPVVHALTELRRRGYFMTVAQVYENPSIGAQVALLDPAGAAPRMVAFDQQREAGQREAFTRFAALRGHG